MYKQQVKYKKMQWLGVTMTCMIALNLFSKNPWLFKFKTKKLNKEFSFHGCTQEMANLKNQRNMDFQMSYIIMRIKFIFKICSTRSKKDSTSLSQSMSCIWDKKLSMVIENIKVKDLEIF